MNARITKGGSVESNLIECEISERRDNTAEAEIAQKKQDDNTNKPHPHSLVLVVCRDQIVL